MSNVASGRDLGKEICEAIGIEPNLVRSISITASVDEVAIVTIERLVSAEAAQSLVELFKKYQYETEEESGILEERASGDAV